MINFHKYALIDLINFYVLYIEKEKEGRGERERFYSNISILNRQLPINY